jgi:hypothetical protein
MLVRGREVGREGGMLVRGREVGREGGMLVRGREVGREGGMLVRGREVCYSHRGGRYLTAGLSLGSIDV